MNKTGSNRLTFKDQERITEAALEHPNLGIRRLSSMLAGEGIKATQSNVHTFSKSISFKRANSASSTCNNSISTKGSRCRRRAISREIWRFRAVNAAPVCLVIYFGWKRYDCIG